VGFKLNLGAWNDVFAVPSVVVDNYIKLAGGNNIKVLLYYLKNAGRVLSVDEVSQKTGVNPDDIQDALLFWEQTGLLCFNKNDIVPGNIPLNNENPYISEHEQITVKPEKTETTLRSIAESRVQLEREPRFCPKEIAHSVRENKGMDFLFKGCEKIFGRTLKHNEQNSLMLITEETGIPAECTLMLVDYCFSIGKPTPAYMKAIAVDWLERGIMTMSAVEDEIKVLREINSLENRLKRLFEMNSAFSKTQKDFIKKWSNLGYGEEMLSEAYQITLDQTGKAAFPYMNKIITKWSENGIKTKEQLEKSQKAYNEKNQSASEAKSSFDLNLISKLINEK